MIGFYITFKNMKHSFENETIKQKRNLQLEKISETPYLTIQLMQESLKILRESKESEKRRLEKENVIKLQKLQGIIYSYGSNEAIKILAELMQNSYNYQENKSNVNVLNYYIILISQLKLDITGEITAPINWIKIFLKDYYNDENKYMCEINDLIEELKLNKEFTINL